jgi:hypothetical protein
MTYATKINKFELKQDADKLSVGVTEFIVGG